MLVVGLLILWLAGGDRFDSAVTAIGETLYVAAVALIHALPGEVYDFTDAGMPPSQTVRLYVAYWLGTAVAIVVVASFVHAALPLLGALRVTAWQRVDTRYDQAKALACDITAEPHLARSALRDYEHGAKDTSADPRELRKALDMRPPIPSHLLRRWASREFAQHRLLDVAFSMTRFFGGAFANVPTISAALRPGVLILASVCVFVGRPLPHQVEWSEDRVAEAAELLTDPAASRLLPFAVLLVALMLISRRTPLIDHIRARDEAAKDANRLLAQLYGRLDVLDHAIYDWRTYLERQRPRMLMVWVENATGGEYGWRHDGGIYKRHSSSDIMQDSMDPNAEIVDKALAGVLETEDRLRDAGLTHVAVSLTRRIYSLMREIGVLRGLPGWNIRNEMPSPAKLAEAFESSKSIFVGLRPSDVRFTAPPSSSQQRPLGGNVRDDVLFSQTEAGRFFESDLEERAYDCARLSDKHLVQLYLFELHLHRVLAFLHRRTRGSALTRSMSVIQK